MVTQIQTFDEILELARQTYYQNFGYLPEIACCAPGRVNLIGEHIDYCDGFVLPMALSMVTIILGGRNGHNSLADIITCNDISEDNNRTQFHTNNVIPSSPKWSNYIKGVIHYFGYPVPGFNAVVISNIPIGGGLSSSAALEVATIKFLEILTRNKINSYKTAALLCQKAEHKFAKMPCGIMDQLISICGKNSNVLLIDCRSIETYEIPFETKDYSILICNSNVCHELSKSEYPIRRKQCEDALKMMNLKSFRDATVENLTVFKSSQAVLMKRARHIITEINRTQMAAKALREGDFIEMGKLMNMSHISLRDDYQVSCKELDMLVDWAINCSGVLGSRMTGGGFGGCTVTIVENKSIDNLIEKLKSMFMEKFNNQPEFYVCTPSEGSRVISL